MGEYRIVLPKTQQGGFSESPDQTISNSGSPMLNQQVTVKNGIGIGIAVMYGKKVASAGFQAVIGQLGNSKLEEAISIGTKLTGYVMIGAATGGVGLLFAVTADAATLAITSAVEGHALNLENERLRITRGTRVNYNAGGYYG